MAEVTPGTAEGLGSAKAVDPPAVSVGTDAAYAPAGPDAAGAAAAGLAGARLAGAGPAGSGPGPLRKYLGKCGISSAPTTLPSTSSAQRPSTCSAWTGGSGTSATSPTTTAGTARTRACSRRAISPTSSSNSGEEITQLAAGKRRGAGLHRPAQERCRAAEDRDWCSSTRNRADLRGTRLRPHPPVGPAPQPPGFQAGDHPAGPTRSASASVPNVLTSRE